MLLLVTKRSVSANDDVIKLVVCEKFVVVVVKDVVILWASSPLSSE